jgi:ABC-type lipoprotein export system ATPase subunit
VRVEHAADAAYFQNHLRQLLTGSGLRGTDYEKITTHSQFSLRKFLTDLEQGEEDLDHLCQTYGLTQTAARKFVEHLNRERRLELDSFRVPDAVRIELNIGTDEQIDYRPLEHLSVGQRCTAILTIILLEGKGPLIIDQPEDDLDNRFIYDEIVQLLRRERGHRQILVATHNANIPVAGDAELITALTATRHETELCCEVLASGFIDNSAVKEQVESILEGGRAAFELRRQKYGF